MPRSQIEGVSMYQLRAFHRRAQTLHMKAIGLFEDMEAVMPASEEFGLMSFASGAMTACCELDTMLDPENTP